MITLFLFIVFLVGLTYQHWIRPQTSPISKFKQFKVPIIILGLLLTPLLIFNIAPNEGRRMSQEEYIAYLEKDGSEDEIIRNYLRIMEKQPRDLEIRFQFIRQSSKTDFFEKERLSDFPFSSNAFVQRQSIAFAEAYLFPTDSINANPVKGAIYSNYILAIEQEGKGNPLLAKLYYFQELEKHPNYKPALRNLLQLARNHYPKLFRKYIKQKRFIDILSNSEQRYLYFQNGQWFDYFKVINKMAFGEIQIFAFLAALAISILWLIFMRSLDVFNKEKWRDILLVFIFGGLFTHVCLLGYDFAHYSLNFTINGHAINDFLYCTFVIGMSEELVKLLPWLLFLVLTKKAKEPYDYLLYASVSALGFAFVENFSYLENPGNITSRSIISTVAHMFDACIVAYGFILGRYKAKSIFMKILFPIAGFLLACLAHGFYDFWLISPAVQAYSMLTIVFFVISVHLWFQLLNNAINNSPFYRARAFNPIIQLDMLAIGTVAILALEYFIMNDRYGTENANQTIMSRGWVVPVFLTYMIVLFAEFKIVKGRWKRFRFSLPRALSFFGNFGRFSEDKTISHVNYEGLELRLFVEKSNRFVGNKFPVSGRCEGLVTVSGSENWSLFRIVSDFSYAGYRSDYVIIRTKDPSESLETDKVEILMLFVPLGLSPHANGLETKQLRFTGRAFARKI